jgi:hypothetical protein
MLRGKGPGGKADTFRERELTPEGMLEILCGPRHKAIDGMDGSMNMGTQE